MSVCCRQDVPPTRTTRATGNYSYLTADFALVTTDASAALVAASTDDGASLSFDRPYKAGWTAKPDTVYRALVYYDKKPTEKVALRAVTQIPVMAVHNPEDVKDMTDAPLGVESVWKAKNGKYVNVALLLKTGKMDDSSQGQTIALVCDSFSDTEDGRKVADLRFVSRPRRRTTILHLPSVCQHPHC